MEIKRLKNFPLLLIPFLCSRSHHRTRAACRMSKRTANGANQTRTCRPLQSNPHHESHAALRSCWEDVQQGRTTTRTLLKIRMTKDMRLFVRAEKISTEDPYHITTLGDRYQEVRRAATRKNQNQKPKHHS